MGGFIIKGKKITAKTIIDGKIIEIKFGTLNSTEELFELIKHKENIKKISIDNIIIKKMKLHAYLIWALMKISILLLNNDYFI